MSGAGFQVHGPHEHELEHAAHHASKGTGMVNHIALFTALVATVGAVFSYMGSVTQAEAVLSKSNATIKKTEASDQWNYFQAKSTKQSLAELSRDLAPAERQAGYQARVDRYEKEKNEIKAQAEAIDQESKAWDAKSAEQMHQHHRWAQATTLLQVSIAMAAIALLTRKKWLEWTMFGIAGVGAAIGVLAVLQL